MTDDAGSVLSVENLQPVGKCTPLRGSIGLAGIAIVLLCAALGSRPPYSVATMIMLPLIIICSLMASYWDWKTGQILRSAENIVEKYSQDAKDVEQKGGGSYYIDGFKKPSRKELENSERIIGLLDQVDSGLQPKRHVLVMVFSSGISLFLLLAFRLVYGAEHFRGYPPLLYFGPKYGDPSEESVSSIAFENEFKSYGHCVQGIIASMLVFPAVVGALSRTLRREGENKGIIFSNPSGSFMALSELTASCMTIYPSYNFVKQAILHYKVFATSSFTNNGMEWAMGFILGISLGLLVSAFIRKTIIRGHIDNPTTTRNLFFRKDHNRELIYGKFDEYPMNEAVVWVIFMVQILLGFLLTFSVYGASILLGHSWNSCEDQTDSCLNFVAEWPSNGLKYGLICIPGLTYILVVLLSNGA